MITSSFVNNDFQNWVNQLPKNAPIRNWPKILSGFYYIEKNPVRAVLMAAGITFAASLIIIKIVNFIEKNNLIDKLSSFIDLSIKKIKAISVNPLPYLEKHHPDILIALSISGLTAASLTTAIVFIKYSKNFHWC